MTTVEISATLKALVERLADAVGGIAELVEEIKIQAEEEGLSPKDIRELIISALKKKNLADRTIRNYLPDFTKRTYDNTSRNLVKDANVVKPISKNEKTTTPDTQIQPPVPTVEIYKGDAGNDPELVSKYVNEPPDLTVSETITILVDRDSAISKLYPLKRGSVVRCTFETATGKLVEIEA